jgi:alpha-beta hydrolase superfamily lysophospholipase
VSPSEYDPAMVDVSAVPGVSSPRAQPAVFGHRDRQVFGFFHAPAAELARTRGVVLCNPLGYEAMSAHRTYRHLAQRLSAAGFPTLRFDYRGTGNSSGEAHDPGRIGAWSDDIRTAVRELRDRSAVQHVALFGVRFGASLAVAAAVEQPEVDALVAWAPIVSGRTHVRELRAYRMMHKDPKAKRVDGGEEIGGYFFARETLSDMASIELLTRTHHGIRRVLVVPRADQPARDEVDLAEHWKAGGADARLASQSGYAPMMRDDPYDSVVPFATLDEIVAWLGEASSRSNRAPARGGATSAVLTVGGPGREPLKETSLLFGEGQRLFGVISELAVPVARPRPAICLLNVGADSHVGPHRMNVELARELASRGYLTFRFDVGGLGESHAAPGKRENRLYRLDSVDDVKSAMTALGRVREAREFVLVGLCSGAFLAYHTAVADERVVGQVLLNMFAFEWQEGDPVAPVERKTYLSSRFYARALLDRRVWLRAFKGEVDARGIAGVVAERLLSQLVLGARSLGARALGRRMQTRIEREFHAVCDRGVRSLMVFSETDGGLDMVARYLGTDARRMKRRKNFAIEVATGVDHTFASIDSQRRLREFVGKYFALHFP